VLIVETNASSRQMLLAETASWGMVAASAENRCRSAKLVQGWQTVRHRHPRPATGRSGRDDARDRNPEAARRGNVATDFTYAAGLTRGHAGHRPLTFASAVAKPVKPAQLHTALEQVLFSSKKIAPAAPAVPHRIFPNGCR